MMKPSIFFVGSQNMKFDHVQPHQFGFVLKWVAKKWWPKSKMMRNYGPFPPLGRHRLCGTTAQPATYFNGHMAVPQFLPEINGGLPMGEFPNFNGSLFRDVSRNHHFFPVKNRSISGLFLILSTTSASDMAPHRYPWPVSPILVEAVFPDTQKWVLVHWKRRW